MYFDEDIGYSPSGNLIGGLLPTNIIQTMGKKKTKKKKIYLNFKIFLLFDDIYEIPLIVLKVSFKCISSEEFSFLRPELKLAC